MQHLPLPTVLAAVLALLVGCRAGGVVHDVAITNVRCLRGDRIPDEWCAVATDGDRISYVGSRAPAARRRIDGQGGVIAPGFLDTNVPGFVRPGLGSDVKLLDGVTTYLSAHGGLPGDAPVVHGQTSVLNYATTVGIAGVRERREGSDVLAALDAGLAAGAYGISLSPEYDPDRTTPDLVRAVCERFGPRAVPIAFHTRHSTPDRELAGVAEAIDCARRGAPVHLLHLASTGGTYHPREAVALVEEARAAGFDVFFDFYPYTSWASSIQRARFSGDWLARYDVGWDRVRVPGRTTGLDATTFEALRRSGRHWIVMVESIPQTTVDFFARETSAPIGSDSTPSEAGVVHPRGAGSFARFLRRYAGDDRERFARALARLSTRAYERFAPWIPALAERGKIEVGYIADVVVWDPATVQDHATSERPLAPSTGVVAALVAGIVVIDERRPVPDVRDTGRWFHGRFTPAVRP